MENDIRYSFVTYVKFSNLESLPKMIIERHEESMYLKLVQEIISSGFHKTNKTGARSLSKFGSQVHHILDLVNPCLS